MFLYVKLLLKYRKDQIQWLQGCGFQVDFKARKVYVKPSIRGDIVRIYFYMSKKYNIVLSKQEKKILLAWDKEDPINDWERLKEKKISQNK